MKIFRSIGFAFAMALSAAVYAAAWIVSPVIRCVAYACEAAADGLQKLDVQLAEMVNRRAEICDSVSGGMNRESHGFRQVGAEESRMADPLFC